MNGSVNSIIQRSYIEYVILSYIELKTNKSPGYDNISSKFIKVCGSEVTPILVGIYNKMINTSVYPDALKIHKIVPIPKVAGAINASEYRPIAVLSAIDKIFEKIIHDKLFHIWKRIE